MPPQPGGLVQLPTQEPLPSVSEPTQPRCSRQAPEPLTANPSIRGVPSCCFHTDSCGAPVNPVPGAAIWLHCQMRFMQPVASPVHPTWYSALSLVRYQTPTATSSVDARPAPV